ncbi:MAG: insulinase family protein [Deltaproteobacteria bacterium]|nr:insulinase family protein [Deltaproteobacteria bacterium]
MMLALLAWMAGAAPVPAWVEEGARSWETRARVEAVLDNGLRVVVVPRGRVPWCGMATVVPGGATTDPPGRSGLAHLAEHLLFESGGGAGPRSDAHAEALGLRSNAFTLGDYTVLVEEFSPAVLREAVAVHAARLARLEFTDADLAREKRVVADERRFRVEEPPLAAADEGVVARLWGAHAFGRPVLGWPAEVAAIAPAEVRAWASAHLEPGRSVLVLAGAVDPAEALPVLRAAMTSWRPATVLPGAPRPGPPPGPVDARLSVMRGRAGAVVWGARAAALGSPGEAVDRVLARLLDGDAAARLPDPPSPGPGTEFHTEYRPQAHHGDLVITAQAPEPGHADLVEAHLAAVLAALADGGPAPGALDAARGYVVTSLQKEVGWHVGLAERLAVDTALLGRPGAHAARQRDVWGVRSLDVRRRAEALRQPGALARVAVVAGEPP